MLVDMLLRRGAKTELADTAGLTPLMYASAVALPSVVALLLDHGAKVDARSTRGATPLHMAAANASVEAAELLLARGARVDAVDDRGLTPLSHACGKTATVLLAHGADKSLLSAEQREQLERAGRTGDCQKLF